MKECQNVFIYVNITIKFTTELVICAINSGQNRPKIKNTLLQTAFSAILPTAISYTESRMLNLCNEFEFLTQQPVKLHFLITVCGEYGKR